MSLVPDYDNSSDSNEENSASDIQNRSGTGEPRVDIYMLPKLPTPDFKVKSIPDKNGPQTNSVFKNPFLEAENEKEALLQKHVRMVDLNNTIVINGKKICWNYRKGRCRFGHNCKFAHDSDIQRTSEQIKAEKIVVEAQGIVVQKEQTSNIQISVEGNDKQHVIGKRKRPGLTQGLTPGKKVMKNYYNLKN